MRAFLLVEKKGLPDEILRLIGINFSPKTLKNHTNGRFCGPNGPIFEPICRGYRLVSIYFKVRDNVV
jgi:hypothetical protein